jgi:hypothetical protein
LNQIQRESVLLVKLKDNLEKYQTFNDGLKEMIENIIALDGKEKVAGMSEEIKNMKFNKILSEISLYMFNYDFNLKDYPFLSDIMLEIIKLKQPNPDADLSGLLKKIN